MRKKKKTLILRLDKTTQQEEKSFKSRQNCQRHTHSNWSHKNTKLTTAMSYAEDLMQTHAGLMIVAQSL